MKKWFRLILSEILLVVFLFSTTGFVLYKSVCSCSGEVKISYTSNDASCGCITTEQDYHSSECPLAAKSHKGCELHDPACHCGSPTAHFYKMENQEGDEIPMLVLSMAQLQVATIVLTDLFVASDNESTNDTSPYYNDPPPLFNSSIEFLNLICQHKIPSITC